MKNFESPINNPALFQIEIFDPEHVKREIEILAPTVSVPIEDGFEDTQLTPQGPEGTRFNELRGIAEDPRGPTRSLLMVTDDTLTRIDALKDRAPHMDRLLDHVRRACTLSLYTQTPLHLPPILLVGPPGTSKTWITWRIGEALKAETMKLNMSISTDISDLTGRSIVWRGSHSGKLARELVRGNSASPIFLLDEIDKIAASAANEKPHDVLHTLLEEDTAKSFSDDYLGFPIRVDKVIWLFTANDITPLPAAVLDRMMIIEAPALSREVTRHIARTIYIDANAALNGCFADNPSSAVLDKLVDSGLREAKRVLQSAFAFAAHHKRVHLSVADIENALHAARPPKTQRMGF